MKQLFNLLNNLDINQEYSEQELQNLCPSDVSFEEFLKAYTTFKASHVYSELATDKAFFDKLEEESHRNGK